MSNAPSPLPLALLLALTACHGGVAVPGDRADGRPFDDVGADEALHFTGTEPFWGGEVTGEQLTYKSPDKPQGQTLAVTRFNGRGGLSYSGTLDGATFTMMVTPGDCSDGMSERSYPLTVTLQFPGDLRTGCAWSATHPFKGPEAP